MFTGIVTDLGRVEAVQHHGRSSRLRIAVDAGASLDVSDLSLGESIAINGACLTVVAFAQRHFDLDVSPETLDRTTLGRLKRDDRVHLERALRMSDRLGGHLVLGHVDGVGQLRSSRAEANARHLDVAAPSEVTRYLVPKGCIAVDGVSLTVNTCDGSGFSVTIVPHTAERTRLGDLSQGDRVNLEADVIGKYVAGLLAGYSDGPTESQDDRLRALVARAGLVMVSPDTKTQDAGPGKAGKASKVDKP